MKKSNTTIYICLGIFAALGILALVLGVSQLISSGASKASRDQVTATITTISEQKNAKGEIYHFVYVDYEYDGVEYKDTSLGVYVSTMHEGKEIEILVSPKDPTDIKLPNQDSVDALASIFMGVIFAMVGIIPMIFMYKGSQRIKKLIEEGYYIYAVVDRVEKNYGTSRNRRHPYVAYCTHEDEETGKKTRFRSPDMWEDPSAYIQKGTRLKVYVNRQNYTNYYVDVDSLF